MSATSSQSRVTISLNLTGQAAAVKGLQQTATAMVDLGKAVADTSASIRASMDEATASFAATDDGVTSMATTMEEAFPQLADILKSFDDQIKLATGSFDALRVTVESLNKSMSLTVPTVSRSLTSGLSSAKTSADGLLSSLTNIKTLLAGGFAVSSLNALSNYSGGQVRLQTLGGLSAKQAASYSGIVNQIASATGSNPTDVMSAAYNPVSEGFNQSQAAQILTDAARVAKMGGAALSGQNGTSYTLSTLLQNLYGGQKGGPTSAQIASTYGLMMATVGAGDMDVNGLLAANSTGIWNTASAYGILPQTTASYLAFMSSQGVNPAEAGTRGRMAISMLASPSGPGRQIEASLGIQPTEMLQLMHGPNGLGAATADLVSHMKAQGLSSDQQAILLSRIFGGARTDASILAIVQHGDLLNQFNQRVGALSDPNRANQAWQTYIKSPAYQMDTLKNSFQNLELEVGKGLLPAFKTLVEVLKPLTAAGSTKIGSDVISGLLLGATLKKILGVLGATKGASAASKILSAASDSKALTGLAGAGTALDAAAALPVAGVALAGGLAAWGIFDGRQSKAMATLLPAGATPGQVRAGTNYASLTPQQWAQVAANAKAAGYARGGVTNGPMAIVGEGRPQYPEYVVPTDPQYRDRALGLFASLGGHLLAAGGTISASEVVLSKQLASGALPGLSTAERSLNQQIALMVGAAQASTLTKLVNSQGATGTAAAAAISALASGSKGQSSPSANKSLAQRLAASLGWTGNEWAALAALWTQESGFNNLAKNPSSGAYGIAQALPASKYPLAGQAAGGSDPTAQIQWGLQYIKQRYGDPTAAEGHEKTFGWYKSGGVLPFASYDSGGYLPEGISLAHNGTGAPEPVGHNLVPAGGGDLHVHVEVDGKEMTKTVIKNFRRQAARL